VGGKEGNAQQKQLISLCESAAWKQPACSGMENRRALLTTRVTHPNTFVFAADLDRFHKNFKRRVRPVALADRHPLVHNAKIVRREK
jgi:hypothetical protein